MPDSEYYLSFDKVKSTWKLEYGKDRKLVQLFKRKSAATKRGVLKKIIGRAGGLIKIEKKDGSLEEERRFRPKTINH